MLDIIVNAPCKAVPKHARKIPCYADAVVHALLALGYALDELPYAPLLAKAKQLPETSVMVSLVHWQASHNDAMFLAWGEDLGLDDRQLAIWFTELAPLLSEGGMCLHDAGQGQWLLSLDKQAPPKAAPPIALCHQSLMPAISALGSSGFWQKLFTEAQMFLHAHPLNSRVGQVAVNGLWFWGGGMLLEQHARPLYTDNPLLQGLAGAQSLKAILQENLQDGVVVLEHPDKAILKRCQALAKKQESRWYWQNAAYKSIPQPWWKRILSRSSTCE